MISLKDIALERGIDVADVIEFINDFIDYSEQEDLKGLQEAVNGRDAPGVRSRAHSMKGAALNLGLTDIAKLAETIEKKGAEGSLEGIQDSVDELSKMVRDLRDFIKQLH
ncbi:MAG: Hpt domain-containing protein [Desulfomonilaceae bacterium]